MKSSYIIWVNRFNREFSPWRLKVQRSCPLRSSGTDAGVVASAKARIVGPLASKQVVDAKPACQDNGTRGSSVERRVLVDGKWLREGNHSDNLLPQHWCRSQRMAAALRLVPLVLRLRSRPLAQNWT